jgi:hypothetical protein
MIPKVSLVFIYLLTHKHKIMKKSFKKLSLNKKTILTLNQSAQIKGGLQAASGVQTCGGEKTQPGCGPSVTCNFE